MAFGVLFIITTLLEINLSLLFLHILTDIITLEACSYLILYKVEAWQQFLNGKTTFIEFLRFSIMVDRTYLECIRYGLLDLFGKLNEPIEDSIRREMNSLFYQD
jgi:hypothetical protein